MTPTIHAPGFYTLGPVHAEGHVDYEGKRLVGSGTVTIAFENEDATSTLTPQDVLEVVRLHLHGTPAARHIVAAIKELDAPAEEPRKAVRQRKTNQEDAE